MTGFTHMRGKRRPIEERFWEKVEKTDGCWLWLGYSDKLGYGRLGSEDGPPIRAHRFSYELNVGPIPEGMVLDHLCSTSSCVRPDHLEPVSQGENIRRVYRDQTHCKRGHEFTEENTYISDKGNGIRRCRRCHADLEAKRRANAQA